MDGTNGRIGDPLSARRRAALALLAAGHDLGGRRRRPFARDPRMERLIEIGASDPGRLTPQQRISIGHYQQARAGHEEQGT